MLDRTRAFTSSDLHDEKMISLGKLSAGLAHELNNPASAIERSAAILQGRLETSVPGVFAAGDLRASAMNRVVSAVTEGSMVVRLTHDYLALT